VPQKKLEKGGNLANDDARRARIPATSGLQKLKTGKERDICFCFILQGGLDPSKISGVGTDLGNSGF
jgi:hypothetical protein